MIKRVIKQLEINEKDTMASAVGKGMIEGAIDGAIVGVGIGLLCIGLSKVAKKEEKSVGELAE